MKKWEYASVMEIEEDIKVISVLGRKGWEVVGFSMVAAQGHIIRQFILKREIE